MKLLARRAAVSAGKGKMLNCCKMPSDGPPLVKRPNSTYQNNFKAWLKSALNGKKELLLSLNLAKITGTLLIKKWSKKLLEEKFCDVLGRC